ncbi:hypothetical protein DFH08DRAFT_1028112 [Mycena albidolilacea]|uniref:SRP9 domain-containing protein n=1 Tax=Mycena albidolilacea TaxID=1033008 RepID=A0AAD6ZIT6_9AGAR|nr:hypothetical protein DFH08DRAFT_1028112 [Mycena albidolilacea]
MTTSTATYRTAGRTPAEEKDLERCINAARTALGSPPTNTRNMASSSASSSPGTNAGSTSTHATHLIHHAHTLPLPSPRPSLGLSTASSSASNFDMPAMAPAANSRYTKHRRFLFSLAIEAKAPTTTRYCVKYKSSEGKLVLKSDNTTVRPPGPFRAFPALNPMFYSLNLSLMEKMQNHRNVESPAAPEPAAAPAPAAVAEVAAAAGSSGTPSAAGAPTAGGVKKKKPKKKK